MQTFFRLTLLAAFAALGIAAAVAVALHLESSGEPTFQQANSSYRFVPEPAQEEAEEETADATDVMPEPPPPAPYAPPVASQFEEIEGTPSRVSQPLRQSQPVFSEAVDVPEVPLEVGPLIRTIEKPQPATERPRETPAEALPPASSNAASPPLALVHKNEGDGLLQLSLQNSDLRQVLQLLTEQGLNILASKNVQGNVSASLSNVDAETALAAILQSTGFTSREGKFLYVGTPQDFVEMDQLKDKINTRIYRTNYVRAADLQTLITPMLTERIGKVTVSAAAENDISPSTSNTGGDSFAVEEVIMVRDYEAVLVQVDQIIEEVDRRPQQVSIEAMILTVKLDDSTNVGVDLAALRDQNNALLLFGAPPANLGAVDAARGGLRFAFLEGGFGSLVSALETVGDTNVVASPKLMCLNKQRAEILIGQQLGYISSTVTETATTQSVQFLEVGTQLRIRPFISRDGMVRLEVHPELSTGNVRVVGSFTLPDKVVTQVTTNIMCRDGCTVVIGGLIREDLGNNVNQVPFLGNLKWLGPLFRRKTETTGKNEIIVVLTPRIVSEPEVSMAGAQATGEYLQRQSEFADRMSPIGKRHYARMRLRQAQDAWAEGKTRSAMRNLELSLRFDPVNLEALRFQNEITGTESWQATGEFPASAAPVPETWRDDLPTPALSAPAKQAAKAKTPTATKGPEKKTLSPPVLPKPPATTAKASPRDQSSRRPEKQAAHVEPSVSKQLPAKPAVHAEFLEPPQPAVEKTLPEPVKPVSESPLRQAARPAKSKSPENPLREAAAP